MRKNLPLLLLAICFSRATEAQTKIPQVPLKTLQGTEIASTQVADSGHFTVISFWATWCKPCMQELDAFAESYDDWKKETHAEVVAIAIDDSRTMNGIPAIIAGHDWPFRCYLDPNQDLKRALNITAVPYTLVLNGKGEIVRRHPGYTPGGENEIKKFLKKQSGN